MHGASSGSATCIRIMALAFMRIRFFPLNRSGVRHFITLRAACDHPKQTSKPESSMAFTRDSERNTDAIPAGHPAQVTDTVLMIRPTHFNYNPKTAESNIYQSLPENLKALGSNEIASLAVQEADKLVGVLKENGVHVIEESPLEDQSDCSDAVFPNNWVSFHEGKIVVYPMMAENRRRERRDDLVQRLAGHLGAEIVNYTEWEKKGKFLEGTGSMVLDRVNKIVYACLSERTHPEVLDEFCKDFGYEAVKFQAVQAKEDGPLVPVYHTNVMFSLGDTFALLCSSCIHDPEERLMVRESLTKTGREVVDIEEKQVYDFVPNTLLLRNHRGERVLVMSSRGYSSLRHDQLGTLQRHVDHIIHSPISTIETLGGGGARCMLAEVFYSTKGKSPREL